MRGCHVSSLTRSGDPNPHGPGWLYTGVQGSRSKSCKAREAEFLHPLYQQTAVAEASFHTRMPNIDYFINLAHHTAL